MKSDSVSSARCSWRRWPQLTVTPNSAKQNSERILNEGNWPHRNSLYIVSQTTHSVRKIEMLITDQNDAQYDDDEKRHRFPRPLVQETADRVTEQNADCSAS